MSLAHAKKKTSANTGTSGRRKSSGRAKGRVGRKNDAPGSHQGERKKEERKGSSSSYNTTSTRKKSGELLFMRRLPRDNDETNGHWPHAAEYGMKS